MRDRRKVKAVITGAGDRKVVGKVLAKEITNSRAYTVEKFVENQNCRQISLGVNPCVRKLMSVRKRFLTRDSGNYCKLINSIRF